MEKVMKGLGINFKSSKEYEPCKEVTPSRKLNYNVVCKTKCNVKQKKSIYYHHFYFSAQVTYSVSLLCLIVHLTSLQLSLLLSARYFRQ